MSKDYHGFRDKMTNDVGAASMAAHSMEDAKGGRSSTSRTRLRASDLPTIVPAGSYIDVEPTTFHKLKHGDIILCRIDRDVNLRRFLRLKMNPDKSATLMVTRESASPMVEMLPSGALVGKVIGGESRGTPVDLKLNNRGMQKLNNKISDFGTTSMGGRVESFLDFFRSMAAAEKAGKKPKKK